jgi:sodium-dependent dicarboxylate transporter 2/3/5
MKNTKHWGLYRTREKRVMTVFVFTAMLWIFKDLINANQNYIKLDDTIIALLCAMALFIWPSGKHKDSEKLNSPDEHEFHGGLLEWSDTKKNGMGYLIIVWWGIGISSTNGKSRIDKTIGRMALCFCRRRFHVVVNGYSTHHFISEVMSNIAQVIVFAPVVCSLAVAVGMNPLQLGLAMTLASSCASMMPMGTPPNAIAFASGHIKIKEMIRAGFVMNIVSIILITLFCWFVLPLIM